MSGVLCPDLLLNNAPTGSKAVASVIKALVKNKYTGSIYPEHPRAFDADRDRVAPGGRLPGVCPDIRAAADTRGSLTAWPTRAR